MLHSPPRIKHRLEQQDATPLKSQRMNSPDASNGTPSSNTYVPKHCSDETEFLLKITYVQSNDATLVHNHHVTFLQFLTNQGGGNIKIYNKRNELLKPVAISALYEESVYKNHFDGHSSDKKIKGMQQKLTTVIQRVHSSFTLNQIKKMTGMMDFLRTNNIRIVEHQWSQDDWDTRMIGFFPSSAPDHHTKDEITKNINERMKKWSVPMPKYRISVVPLHATIKGLRIRVFVFGIEVRSKDVRSAYTALADNISQPDDFIPFRMRQVNEEAFNNGVAMVAEYQQDLRTIVIDNVTTDAYFVMENKARQMEKVITTRHISFKQSMRITVHSKDFSKIREEIKGLMTGWIQELDPSDLRGCRNDPEVAHIFRDDISDDSDSRLSVGIQSLLSLDLSELTIFKTKKTAEKPAQEIPMSDITTETTRELSIIHHQQEIINRQSQQIEKLTNMMNDFQQHTESRISALMSMFEEVMQERRTTPQTIPHQETLRGVETKAKAPKAVVQAKEKRRPP
jgi:hypothetical protein